MAGEKLLGGLLTQIDVMVGGLEANAEGTAHLNTRKGRVATLQVELADLNVQQEAAKALVQQLTAQIKVKLKEGKREIRLLKKGVQAIYGDDVQKLEEFGIRVK